MSNLSPFGRRCLLIPCLIIIIFATSSHGLFENCTYPKVKFNPELEIQRYGKPTPFVSTKSVGISPYSLVDPYRQSTLYHEYLLIGPGIRAPAKELVEIDPESGNQEEINLIVYDGDATHSWINEPNIIEHNLGKEYNWALINATGMLPSLTIVNTTFERTFRFHSDPNDTIAYHLQYPNLLRSKETIPPLDMLVEFPAKTRTLLTLKTLIDYQSFGLLRWRLTPSEPVLWNDLHDTYEFARPSSFVEECNDHNHGEKEKDDKMKSGAEGKAKEEGHGHGNKEEEEELHTSRLSNKQMMCIYQNRFSRLENPCIKDMFALYTIRGEKRTAPNTHLSASKLFIIVPMVYDVLNYKGWIDLTEAYCSRPDEPEECGEPLAVVLTNDHLLIHTDKGLYVSNGLNVSNVNVSHPYSMKPLMKFTPIDPCASFDNFNCSEVGAPILGRQTLKRQRLFYTPVCHLFQHPSYDDMVMLVIEHSTQTPDLAHELDVITVLYAPKPYDNWKILFFAQHQYHTAEKPIEIKELVGLFLNHHRRVFDISLLLNDNGMERTIRFVLPEPTEEDFKGYDKLDGLQGNGFLEFEFPPSFHMSLLNVHPEHLDVFFLGNQMWIAEAGGAFVYLSVPIVYNQNKEESSFDGCSFNHPDRTYVCTEKSHAEIFVGRVGVTYSPIGVNYFSISEFKYSMLYNLWPFKYRQSIALLGHFVASYSGKVMLWYLYDHNKLVEDQQELPTIPEKYRCMDEDKDDVAVKCHVCKRLQARNETYNCKITNLTEEDNRPHFRMLSFDPTKLKVREASTHGPLVPFLMDGDKVIMFEAAVPHFEGHKPDYNYLHDINVGNRILCGSVNNPKANESSSESHGHGTPEGGGEASTGGKGGAHTEDESSQSQCPDINSGTSDSQCELYIRHMKLLRRRGEFLFLNGIRRAFFATIVRSFPILPVPTAVIVLVFKDTNNALVQLDFAPFVEGKAFEFGYEHVGQTLYIPEHFSVLLTGFPEYETCSGNNSKHNMTRMTGFATRYHRLGKRLQIKPFKSFLINFSTRTFCQYYRKSLEQLPEDCSMKDVTAEEYERRINRTDLERNETHEQHKWIIESVNAVWEDDPANTIDEGDNSGGNDEEEDNGEKSSSGKKPLFPPLDDLDPPSYADIENEILNFVYDDNSTLQDFIDSPDNVENHKKFELNITGERATFQNYECPADVIWQITDGGCHLQLYLVKHPVLKQNGGRVSLDKYDSLSFTVKLRSLTPLGKSLIYRPLMTVTNTNPGIITVDRKDTVGQDPQTMLITLTPTGLRKGVATVSVRPLIVSTHCPFADGGFTLLVQVQRIEGRRLHVNYPIPKCKPSPDDGEWERPWKVDLPTCVTREELLKKKVIRRSAVGESKHGQIFYTELPDNYRPPSLRGSQIPESKNVYNVDPEKPNFKDWYQFSKDEARTSQCAGKETKKDCVCSPNIILADDEIFTDCKRVVYIAKRSFRVDISVEYDRLMRDDDQHSNFFSPKTNWSVYVSELNNRTEFTLSSRNDSYLRAVSNLTGPEHAGLQYFDAGTLGVTLHGTGLFHFRVTLSSIESFDRVSGFFMVYCVDSALNHVQLMVLMLLTITICMVLVFCGFLMVRSRLSAQLPFQTMNRNKIKLE